MGDIKFRGRREDDGGWIQGDLLHLREGVVHIKEEGTNISRRVKPRTIGQYTTIRDRDGAELWKGDVVEFDHGDGTVSACRIQWCELNGAWIIVAHRGGSQNLGPNHLNVRKCGGF